MQAELRKAITFAVSRITPGGSISREMSLSSRQPASRGRAAPRGGAGFSSVRRQWGARTDVTLHSRGGRRVKFAVAVVRHIRAHSREDHRNPEPIKAGCQAVRVNTTSSSPSEADAHSPDQTRARLRGAGVREALAFCAERRNLRRTIRIAIVVGIILTLINQGSVIAEGHATSVTWVRCALNFIVPFLASSAGLLSARR